MKVKKLNELKIQLSEFPLALGEDELVWTGASSEIFLGKAMVNLVIMNLNGPPPPPSLVWKNLAPPRVQTFAWCGVKRKILTKMDLRRRGLLRSQEDLGCPLYGLEEEIIDHLFFTCPIARILWG